MLKKQPADDLFEKSSMSFGEHLEELRKALIKAFIWLGIGTAIGLFFAERIVVYFQVPLEQAIRDFHVVRAQEEFKQANGEKPTTALAALISEKGVTPEITYVDPTAIARALADSAATDAVIAPSEESTLDEKGQESSLVAVTSAAEAEVLSENPWKDITADRLNRLRKVILWKPISTKLVSLTITEGFMIWLKAGLVAGVVIGSPGIFWHIWQFFAAGLYPHERRYVYWYLPLSLLLFLAGVALAFGVIFRLIIGFLMQYTSNLGVEFTPRLNDYMSFALMLPLGFGVAFQLPLVMLGLHRFGLVSVELFISQWRVAVLIIAFLSMVLTPAEIYSMIGLFVPLTGLYFFGILLCKYMPRGAGIGSAALDPKN
ncbi:MAG: twin-arginine translocase subunit TatC [Planctomycetales bacterium]|nr:twin-arginine translocase subunit TatC [Planctomycetales bacterium]